MSKSKQAGMGMLNFLLLLAVFVAIVVLALPRFMEGHKEAEQKAEGALSSLYKANEKSPSAAAQPAAPAPAAQPAAPAPAPAPAAPAEPAK